MVDVISTLKDTELEDTAQRALQTAREFAREKVVPASTERLRELAERIQLDKYRDQVQHLEGDFSKRAKKLERKLERRVKRLPVDTPLDRRRRRRARRRGAGTAGTLVLIGFAGAVGYSVWRSRRANETGPGDHADTPSPGGDGAYPSSSEPRGSGTESRAGAGRSND